MSGGFQGSGGFGGFGGCFGGFRQDPKPKPSPPIVDVRDTFLVEDKQELDGFCFTGSAEGRFLFAIGNRQICPQNGLTYDLHVFDMFLSTRRSFSNCPIGLRTPMFHSVLIGFYSLNRETLVVLDYCRDSRRLEQAKFRVDLMNGTITPLFTKSYADVHLTYAWCGCIGENYTICTRDTGAYLLSVDPQGSAGSVCRDISHLLTAARAFVNNYNTTQSLARRCLDTHPFIISDTVFGMLLLCSDRYPADDFMNGDELDLRNVLCVNIDTGAIYIQPISQPIFGDDWAYVVGIPRIAQARHGEVIVSVNRSGRPFLVFDPLNSLWIPIDDRIKSLDFHCDSLVLIPFRAGGQFVVTDRISDDVTEGRVISNGVLGTRNRRFRLIRNPFRTTSLLQFAAVAVQRDPNIPADELEFVSRALEAVAI